LAVNELKVENGSGQSGQGGVKTSQDPIYERSETSTLVFKKIMRYMCVYTELHKYVAGQQSHSSSARSNAFSQSLSGGRNCSCACCYIVTMSRDAVSRLLSSEFNKRKLCFLVSDFSSPYLVSSLIVRP
jgi:hypothetical protein